MILLALGRRDEAIAELDAYVSVVERFGDSTEPAVAVARELVIKGWALGLLGRHDEQVAAYTAVVERFGDSTEPDLQRPVAIAHLNRAIEVTRAGDLTAAAADCEKRLILAPENSFAAYVLLGMIAVRQGRTSREHFEAALAGWQAACDHGWQGQAELLYYKSVALVCLGRDQAARDALAAAIDASALGEPFDVLELSILRDAPAPPAGLDELAALLASSVESGRIRLS
jgi:tetratricopeptide (TPR) repeat protein